MHWIPKLLIGFFVMLALINAALLTISTRGLPRPIARLWLPHGGTVNSGFSGVVPHSEEAAKTVGSELSRSHAAAQTGWRVELDGLAQTAQPRQRVRLKVSDRTGLPVSGLYAELTLARPGAAEALARIAFVPTSEGEYGAELDLPARGRWLVELQLRQHGALRYHESREIVLP